MSGHRSFMFMLALVPVAITGLLYASVVSVEKTIYQHKVDTLLKRAAACQPAIEADAQELPQQAPQDEPEACVDGPNSVFHPLEDFDDLVNRSLPEPDTKAIDINVRPPHH
jgi:hypothetical protein